MNNEDNVQKSAIKTKSPLTKDEKVFIETHCQLRGWSDQKIADRLGRSKITILRYRQSLNINKNNTARNADQHGQSVPIDSKTVNTAETVDRNKESSAKKEFLKSLRADRLSKILSPDDLNYFADQWAKYSLQFKNLTATEEDSLEKLIILDIRILYNQKTIREIHLVNEKLRSTMDSKGDFNPENDRDLQILHTIDAYNGQEIELNKQYAMLIKEYKELQKSMNATREQREANQKIGSETFFDLLKKFNQKEFRDEVGRQEELIKLSKNKKIDNFKQPHKYSDGSYDLPILDGATIKQIKEAEKNEQKE